ncbi:MAG: galactokinase [Marmoricola sp.]
MQTVTAWAPGRVNLIGEHLDYNGGHCLPIAIGLGTTATVTRSSGPDHLLRSDVEPDGWTAYVRGVLTSLGVTEPLEVSITSDLPIGAGLSSSAALECSVALAVDTLLGLHLERENLLAACVRAENEYVGVPSGGMDQAASLFASAGSGLLLDFADGSRREVPLDLAGYCLLVVDTRVSHALTDGGYAARAADCAAAAAELDVPYLARATGAQIDSLTDPRVRRRARHVVSEQARVESFVTAAARGRWHTAGAMMTASHRSLREDFEVSCPELDAVVEAALAAGARGARMTGGGFGGSAVVLAPSSSVDTVGEAVRRRFAENEWDAPTVFVVEASRGAQVLSAT